MNRASPLNRGLDAWFLSLPNSSGGGTFVNLANSQLNGTLTNMSLATETSGWRANSRPGALARCLAFDASNDYVAVGTSSTFDAPTAITVALWARPTTAIDLVSLFGKYVSGPENGLMLESGTSGFGGTDGLLITACNGGSQYGFASSILTLNQWVHLVAVFNGAGAGNSTRMRLYKNGTEVTLSYNGTIPSSIGSNASAPRIGANGDGRYFAGQIDDVRVYGSRAIDPTEARLLYEASRLGYPSALNRWRRGFSANTGSKFRRTIMNRTGSRGAIV